MMNDCEICEVRIEVSSKALGLKSSRSSIVAKPFTILDTHETDTHFSHPRNGSVLYY